MSLRHVLTPNLCHSVLNCGLVHFTSKGHTYAFSSAGGVKLHDFFLNLQISSIIHRDQLTLTPLLMAEKHDLQCTSCKLDASPSTSNDSSVQMNALANAQSNTQI